MTAVKPFRDTTAPQDAWTQEADAVSLPRLDEVGGHVRPSGVGVTYAEQEYHALADEQELTWPAEGERAARPFQERARGLERVAAGTEFLLSEQEQEVRQARADYQHAAWVLTPYTRREPGAKLRYWICWPVLWFGDTAGVWSAAVVSGDVPSIAFGQSLASGLAAACAGLVGAELKYIRMAKIRQRDPESLTDDEARYVRLFSGADNGGGIVKLIGLFSLVVVALLVVGIFCLRASIEGSASGITFGLLAAATAIGSGLLGYSAADEVADLLAATAKRVQKAERRYLKLAKSSAIRGRTQAEAAERSIRDEYQLRGQAAGKRVESLSWRVQRRNPQVLGHGFPNREQGGVIGRRTRRGGDA
ncbi:hypothetical protein [Streptomyces griseorubiginosus]|uniref:hypothetical protein n=1 Tax=Streptomyces griseorubiginosus TaxID=67304 RepID=UPI002E8123D8|nr:hypothetical protein [Streptomyces griseorubiginosus]WUB46366.1 hypothetical protein OHN19_24740 [Streptomyces griseorubiginosus]WUB54887.1 hypothetical protein OG942_24745 [Streptomyces griseorubiginosus]